MNQEKLAKLQAQVRIGGKVIVHIQRHNRKCFIFCKELGVFGLFHITYLHITACSFIAVTHQIISHSIINRDRLNTDGKYRGISYSSVLDETKKDGKKY